MKEVIAPIDRNILKQELEKSHFLRPTHKAGNLIYDITAHEAPHVMTEIGRLRELSFRSGGGGSGQEVDIDHFDTMEQPYHQLIVWDPDGEAIIGGYRFLQGSETQLLANGQPNVVGAHMFHFCDEYIKNYMPYTTELGRAFVQPAYQNLDAGIKSMFALDNLWDGLGALVYDNPDIKYLIGKVTIYPSYNALARDLIYEYLHRFFPGNLDLIITKKPITTSPMAKETANRIFMGSDQKLNYKILQKAVRELGETIPPLFSAYIGLSPTMQTFGTGINDEFADIYDTGIMITIADIFADKKERYIDTYKDYLATIK